MSSLSAVEKAFIIDGVAQDLRGDGRCCRDYRPMSVETGLLATCNGSSRVRLDASDVVVGVKFEVGQPSVEQPRAGIVECTVEFAPGALNVVSGAGGSGGMSSDDVASLAAELGKSLQQSVADGRVLPLDALVIEPRTFCWIVHIDGVVNSVGGNLLDVLSIATRAALFNARLPRVRAVPSDDGSGTLELEVEHDVLAGALLDLSRLPLCITLSRIGEHFLVDATPDEMQCASGAVVIAVAANDVVCSLEKLGDSSLPASIVFSMISAAKQVAFYRRFPSRSVSSSTRLVRSPKRC
jgi:exosome complex component RRP42